VKTVEHDEQGRISKITEQVVAVGEQPPLEA